MTVKNILTIIIAVELLFSCSHVDETKNSDVRVERNNMFPIEYIGDKVLEYNKPMTPPKGGLAHLSDTFNLYRLINKSLDTIWVSTLKDKRDKAWYFLKDSSIKTITMGKIYYRSLDSKIWHSPSEGNCWGNCDFRVRLSPNQSLLFIMGAKGWPEYDSTQFNIFLKLKKGLKTIDSTLTKRLVLTNNHFVDDTTKWTN